MKIIKSLIAKCFGPKTATGSFIDSVALGSKIRIDRNYYGANKTKPNDHCFWDDEFRRIVGWYETDEHLKKRVSARIEWESLTEDEKTIRSITCTPEVSKNISDCFKMDDTDAKKT